MAEILAGLPTRPPLPPAPDGPAVVRCEIHGDYLGDWTPTPFREGHQDWEATGECMQCQADAKITRLMARTGISPRFRHATFDSFVATTKAQRGALAACRDYAEAFAANRAAGRCVIMIGKPGTGKNHLATAISRYIAAKGFSSLHCTAHDLIKEIRSTWNRVPGADTEEDVLRRFTEVDLLVIDEVGRAFGTPGEQVHLFEVIDRRYREMMPTCIISNLKLSKVIEVIGEATYDRLREGGALGVSSNWPSHRDASPSLDAAE